MEMLKRLKILEATEAVASKAGRVLRITKRTVNVASNYTELKAATGFDSRLAE